MESGVHISLRPNCHYKVVFAKFNLSILYPPPYERTLCFYEKVNPELIQRAINEFDWIRTLSRTLLNIIHNFISHERIVCGDIDPPWINNENKKLIREKNLAYKPYCRFYRDVFLFEKFKFLKNQLNVSIENSKALL